MKWLRFRAGGRERFGVLAGDMVQAYEGEMPGAFGPVIETELDPAGGELVTLLNGRECQRHACSDMISNPTQRVSLISQDMTLVPGDVILRGTSPGAMPMTPGSTVEVIIKRIGDLANEYRAAD